VVRTGPRFRLMPSVGPYSVDDRLCKRAQQSDSVILARVFNTTGSAGGGDDSHVCAEMSNKFETQDRAFGGGSTMELHTGR
jgi:hypothetical protein